MQGRPVGYVHCVMQKCIMVKPEGNEKHVKYVKTRTFNDVREKFQKVGGNNKFPDTGGNVAF